jgi:hypothetical protein
MLCYLVTREQLDRFPSSFFIGHWPNFLPQPICFTLYIGEYQKLTLRNGNAEVTIK